MSCVPRKMLLSVQESLCMRMICTAGMVQIQSRGGMHGQEDLPEQEDPIRHWPRGYMPGIYFPDRYAPDRYDPDRYALDRRTPDRYREQGPPEPYLPGRERHTPWKKPPKRQELQPQGEEGAPAELSRGELQYQLELAVNNLQKARRELKALEFSPSQRFMICHGQSPKLPKALPRLRSLWGGPAP
jgi:hypothetical protein